MADDAGIRRTNLQRLLRQRGWTAADLSDRYHGRYTYWRDLLKDPNKSFGEKVARRLEEEADLPRLWLDTPEADLEILNHPHKAGEPPPAMEPARWPFSRDLWLAVSKLDEDQLLHAERVLRAHLSL